VFCCLAASGPLLRAAKYVSDRAKFGFDRLSFGLDSAPFTTMSWSRRDLEHPMLDELHLDWIPGSRSAMAVRAVGVQRLGLLPQTPGLHRAPDRLGHGAPLDVLEEAVLLVQEA